MEKIEETILAPMIEKTVELVYEKEFEALVDDLVFSLEIYGRQFTIDELDEAYEEAKRRHTEGENV